ncbi:HesB/IscA family protein [Methanolobus halotolerans]|uniref:Iron-sulfur cluster assembly accessory protein n=1 Tax=Methanolobus halotolerans TaxID=2052935 RepID=A0A4E0Q8I2_9EURY|nr:iron-sulfur cluster assembly accessory protein [Methanolobus halotolerans]TGC08149.1 iron-sulfur cluster assembly accessory protein [Methanolobus halotolerans]
MVDVSDKAAAELKTLLDEQEKQDYSLRVFIAGMSCCGVQYGMSLENEISEEDVTEEINGLKIVMNKDDVEGLSSATIDYVDGPQGKGFVIDNSSSANACGSCGGGCS